MKRWTGVLAASVIAAALVLGGCTEAPAGDHGQTRDESESQDLSSHGYEKADSVTYLKVLKEFIPVSLIQDGEQQITGDVLPMRSPETISGLSSAPKADTLSEIGMQSMYTSQTTVPTFRGYTSDDVMDVLASNGEWDFFPVKVTYEKYTLSTQPQRPEWTNYFQSKLEEESANAPVIFTEAWFFDWSGSGCQSVIVNAGNVFLNDSDDFIAPLTIPNVPNPPEPENTKVYQFSSMFIYGIEQKSEPEAVFDFIDQVMEVPSDATSSYSYMQQEEEAGIEPRTLYYAIQRQSDQNLRISPIYIDHIGNQSMDPYVYNNVYALSDIDGNGQAELLAYKPVLTSNAVYIYQSDEGVPKETSAVIFR